MTTILTPTTDGIVVTSSLAGAKVGRFCKPPQVPDRCYTCFDEIDGNIVHRPATGYTEETHIAGADRYGTCPACWSRRTQRPYRQWSPAGTNCVYRAAQVDGRWSVYGFNRPAACAWPQYSKAKYLHAEHTGPLNHTTVYLTDKALAEAEEYFLVQDEQGDWHAVHADGTPLAICFHCGLTECRCPEID